MEAEHQSLNEAFRHALDALITFETKHLGRTERESSPRDFFLKDMDPGEAKIVEARHDELLRKYDEALTELVTFQKEQLNIV
jgi:hypothetical protein